MTDLLWPGDHRAGEVFSSAAFVRAMVRVEAEWAGADLDALVTEDDLPALAVAAEKDGNPLIPLLALLRERAEPSLRERLHRGLTSQDVIDSALMLCARDAVEAVTGELARQIARLDELERLYGATPMMGRTLAQQALPITFGHKAATWRAGLTAAEGRLAALDFPAQHGGPVGLLGPNWQTERSAVTGVGDALTTASDAWGRIANDVALLSRQEFGELREASGGGSSSMPHKQNPVLSILVKRHALTAPQLAATLHLAAAGYVDERPDGAWHAEWSTLATLARHSVTAAKQTTDLLDGLVVETAAMEARVREGGQR